MKVYRFRGWCIRTGEWVYGGGIDSQRDTPIIINHGNRYFVDAESVGQFTTLKDENGVDIYGNDICEVVTNGSCYQDKVIRLIKFCDGRFNVGQGAINAAVSFKVIGNKFQNPELLKQQSDR